MKRAIELPLGGSRCLCRGCGQVFSTVRNFERHRRGSECRPPASVGLQRVDGVWRRPPARSAAARKQSDGNAAARLTA